MGKQVRKSFKPRTNPIGVRANGNTEFIADQQITIQPDQVLPVVDKVYICYFHLNGIPFVNSFFFMLVGFTRCH